MSCACVSALQICVVQHLLTLLGIPLLMSAVQGNPLTLLIPTCPHWPIPLLLSLPLLLPATEMVRVSNRKRLETIENWIKRSWWPSYRFIRNSLRNGPQASYNRDQNRRQSREVPCNWMRRIGNIAQPVGRCEWHRRVWRALLLCNLYKDIRTCMCV